MRVLMLFLLQAGTVSRTGLPWACAFTSRKRDSVSPVIGTLSQEVHFYIFSGEMQ